MLQGLIKKSLVYFLVRLQLMMSEDREYKMRKSCSRLKIPFELNGPGDHQQSWILRKLYLFCENLKGVFNSEPQEMSVVHFFWVVVTNIEPF